MITLSSPSGHDQHIPAPQYDRNRGSLSRRPAQQKHACVPEPAREIALVRLHSRACDMVVKDDVRDGDERPVGVKFGPVDVAHERIPRLVEIDDSRIRSYGPRSHADGSA